MDDKAARRIAIREFSAALQRHGTSWTDGELDEVQFAIEGVRDAKVAEEAQ